jgi:FkbM family methyltransferase
MGSASIESHITDYPKSRRIGFLKYLTETRGRRPSTTAKVLCNMASYSLVRAIGHRNPPGLGWHASRHHWYRFPFSLRGEVLWSPQLAAWFCPENEASIELMLHEADYEPVEWVELNEGEVFLDIGAFVGWHSIRAARMVGPSARIISLEPDATNRRQLERNLALNNVTNCTIIPLAAWSKSGVDLGWFTEKSPDCCRVEENQVSSGIKTITVDDLAADLQLERLDWIKMDIEGGEVEALKGAGKTLRKFRPFMFIEIHDTVEPVKELLHRFGYAIEREAYDRSPAPHGWYVARPLSRENGE